MEPQGVQIQGSVTDRVAKSLGAGRHIAVNLVSSPYESVGANLIALLNCSHAANSRILSNTHMSAELATVRDDDSSPDIAIVGNMRIRHNQYFICNMRTTPTLDGSAIQGAVFADDAIFAYFKPRRLPRILEVLRRGPENGAIVNMHVLSNGDAPIHMDARLQNNSFGNFCACIDKTPGTNNSGLMYFGLWAYKCRRVNHG